MVLQKRLTKEKTSVYKNQEETFLLYCNENNAKDWRAYLLPPEDCPFGSGIFKIKIQITDDYPIKPPIVHFETRIFHPNIHWTTGEACQDILKENWTPQWTLNALCLAMIDLIQYPNADSPFNCDAGNLVRRKDMVGYESLARFYTEMTAIPRINFTKLHEELLNE